MDLLRHGQALLLDSDLVPLFQFKWTSWGLLLGTQVTPLGVDFLDHNFLSSKNLGKDLSNEGSNLILSSLEVGHRVAQT